LRITNPVIRQALLAAGLRLRRKELKASIEQSNQAYVSLVCRAACQTRQPVALGDVPKAVERGRMTAPHS